MKKEKRLVDIELTEVQLKGIYDTRMNTLGRKYKYTFESDVYLDSDNIEVRKEVEVPETMNEFLDMHGLKKKELVKWLNENYKK